MSKLAVMNRLIWMAAGVLVLPGCSSIVEGTTQEILVNTNPAGAHCSLLRGGITLGRIEPTPGAVTVKKTKDDIMIVCDKDGFQEASFLDHSGLSELVWFGAGVGWGVDSASGADNKYQTPINLTLFPVQTPDRSAQSLPGAELGDLGNDQDANIVTRFQTLHRLLDEGLITRDEYNRRRGANLGALLRYTVGAPAADLGRSAPNSRQLVDRLKYLKVAFDEKSITAKEQEAERVVILDALLPAAPVLRADPPVPVTDQLQAAAQIGRLERLASAKVITADEQARERAAIFRSVQVAAANAEAAYRSAAGMMQPVVSAHGPGVRLGSYRTENQARLAWASLQLTHSTELGGLQQEIRRVGQRRRGVSYQLIAGPVTDRRAADSLCRTLRSGRQACQVTTFGK